MSLSAVGESLAIFHAGVDLDLLRALETSWVLEVVVQLEPREVDAFY
jgi:hypothetical protein